MTLLLLFTQRVPSLGVLQMFLCAKQKTARVAFNVEKSIIVMESIAICVKELFKVRLGVKDVMELDCVQNAFPEMGFQMVNALNVLGTLGVMAPLPANPFPTALNLTTHSPSAFCVLQDSSSRVVSVLHVSKAHFQQAQLLAKLSSLWIIVLNITPRRTGARSALVNGLCHKRTPAETV